MHLSSVEVSHTLMQSRIGHHLCYKVSPLWRLRDIGLGIGVYRNSVRLWPVKQLHRMKLNTSSLHRPALLSRLGTWTIDCVFLCVCVCVCVGRLCVCVCVWECVGVLVCTSVVCVWG